MSNNLFNDDFPDAVFNLWKKEEGKSTAGPPLFAMNILERLGHLNHWTESVSLLDEAATSIKELDAYQKFFTSHLNSIQEAVGALRSAVRPFMFGKGIDALPDEILSTIFESFETERRNTVTQTCSLVSRRFRRVVLNTPRLWCTVSNDMASMDSVVRNLERSKSTGLKVQIQVAKNDPNSFISIPPNLDCLKVFDAVLAHSKRWESFQCELDNGDRITSTSGNPDICEHLKKLPYLPCLKEIRLLWREESPWVEDPIFLRSLRAPQLHRLHVVHCLPGPSALTSTLTSLNIELWDIEVESRLPHRLYALLTSIPNLAEFTLFLDILFCLPASDGEFPPFVLPKLKFFQFSAQAIACDHFLSFRKALITPAIVDCFFLGRIDEDACSVNSDNQLQSNFLDFMLCHDEYPTLEALSVKFESYEESKPGFSIPFDKIPNLRELTLDIEGLYIRNGSKRMPALRSLTVRSCSAEAWDWMRILWIRLHEQGDLPGLQKVVVGKRTVSQEWVEKCFEDEILCGRRDSELE